MLELDRERQWALASAGAAMAAGALVQGLLEGGWRLATDEEPPADPTHPDTSWGQALAWTAMTALGVGLAQLAARRGAAILWTQATGEAPPRPRRRKKKRGPAAALRRLARG